MHGKGHTIRKVVGGWGGRGGRSENILSAREN